MKSFVFNQPLTKLHFVLPVLAILFAQFLQAQITLTSPLDNQLFPVNYSDTTATVQFTGTITGGVNSIKIYESVDGALPFNFIQSQNISGTTINTTVVISRIGGSFLHRHAYQITSVTGTTESAPLITISNIVAGDVYLINGQSNAVAQQRVMNLANDANADAGVNQQWVRSWGNAKIFSPFVHQWFVADGNAGENGNGNIGQWAMRMAANIVQTRNLPVCIINGGTGGAPISYFQKANGSETPNNYNRLLNRTNEAFVRTKIRAIFWYQGESNWGDPFNNPLESITTAQYITAFNTLFNNWKNVDFTSVEKFYLVQPRFGCWSFADTALRIQEAFRQIDESNTQISLLTNSNSDQVTEGGFPLPCHYFYVNGYQRLGNEASNFLLRDLYGQAMSPAIEPPAPSFANFTNKIPLTGIATEITIFPKDMTTALTVVGDNTGNFELKGINASQSWTVNSVTVPGGTPRIVIGFTRNGATNTNPGNISYISHTGTASPVIINSNGLGMENYSNLAIDLGILPLDPLELTASKKDKGNALHWNVETNEDFRQFIVERSEDGQNFIEIASINPSNLSLKASYDYTDQSPTSKCLYRVKGLKRAGNYIYSQVVAISGNSRTAAGLLVYPNPVTDRATFSLSLDDATMADIQIFSVSGKLMSTRKISLQRGSNYVGVSEATILNPGIYLLRVVTPDQTFTGRLVKSK